MIAKKEINKLMKIINIFVAKFSITSQIPLNYTVEEVAAGFEYLNAFTDYGWVPPSGHNTAYLAADAVLRHNNISLYEAATHVSAGCEDFVQRCFWGIHEFRCRQDHQYLSFAATISYLGPCCSFNYNPSNLSYVPFSANIFGINGGLTFVGVEGSQRNLSTGLIVLVHHPMDFVTEATTSITITANSESFVEVTPTVRSSSNEVLELSENKRDCLISNDLALTRYRQASCLVACQTQLLMEHCHCQPYHLPYGKTEFECKLKDSLCYMKKYGE